MDIHELYRTVFIQKIDVFVQTGHIFAPFYDSGKFRSILPQPKNPSDWVDFLRLLMIVFFVSVLVFCI